ncbi:MAG: Asp-tRNA(Asn)/Glu-tRNA(Gln) amidotransferase subunit GatB [Oscillospiraceae bacterium]|jgi:aspartyl-tRNA(Asn)/glutamyl-tRNA(Gln) amidotransferase subunit B|nr:Asp-tRNA(Asn)/Glu-tRNA(Gln) amidotransferase subunit GatB [Oscillospiraceae bacterium]
MIRQYEMVIGLEVHVELSTKTKLFCGCSTAFGAEPNTQCCPVCTGMPGALPVLNQTVVDYAVKAGLATHCHIASHSKQDRKNYFYPDLPKAYQISQYDLPLCEHGHLEIESAHGSKQIGITRIHIEEDAGKLVHNKKHGTMIDYNRCGIPLIEIVSEPDLRSAEEAKSYLQKLRAIILYTGISDCKMNEGSFRCDVNLSVRKAGTHVLGTRTEMKNLNSFRSIVRAIDYEYKRQVEALEAGEEIVQETRRFDKNDGKTHSMRRKENANDYRYFPDPDLPPIYLTEETIASLEAQIPTLPDARKKVYMEQYGLSAYDGECLTTEKAIADYFDQAVMQTKYPKLLSNLMISELCKLLPPDSDSLDLEPAYMAWLADLSGDEIINSSTAKNLVQEVYTQKTNPETIVKERGLEQISDVSILQPIAEAVLAAHPKSVADYQKGKTAASKALIGQVMAQTRGKGNPQKIQEIIFGLLSKT